MKWVIRWQESVEYRGGTAIVNMKEMVLFLSWLVLDRNNGEFIGRSHGSYVSSLKLLKPGIASEHLRPEA